MSSPGGLSVCCLTAERPAMVAAAMTVLREVADQIVIAVDQRVDTATLWPLLDVADLVVRFEFVDPPERARPWLLDLCRHPAALMLDGDEVASAALVDALPALVADAHTEQVRIARRWCFPDERSWLAERPWWPDFQRRFVRRGPALDFDIGFHGGVRPAQPTRIIEEPMYHLVNVVRSVASRRARARLYDSARPGFVAVGGGAMNDILYDPERYATLRPAPTPPIDEVALRRTLYAPDVIRSGRLRAPIVGAAEIAAHIRVGPFDGAAADGVALRVVEDDVRSDPGHDTAVLVEIINRSDHLLPCRDAPGVALRIVTTTVDGQGRAGASAATMLPCDVPAADRRLVDAHVVVPAEPGRYVVEVGLRNERGGWPDAAVSTTLDATTRWGRFGLEH